MARRTLLITLAAALVMSSCTRPTDDAGSADSTIPPVTGSNEATDEPTDVGDTAVTSTTSTTAITTTTTSQRATTTSEQPDGTAAPATTTRPTTSSTTPLPDDPSDLTLIFDGVLPFRFGDRDVEVVPALADVLGPPTQDTLTEYPDADRGVFFDTSGEESFVARFGRSVCYANSLCVQFGAGAPETLIFTGWRVDDASAGLTTDDGLAIGSSLAEFSDLITFDPLESCYQVAFGSAAGIDVTLLSDDDLFAAPSPDGESLVPGDPDPAAVTVIEMRAGQLPVFVFADC